jgi:hypothetical protein
MKDRVELPDGGHRLVEEAASAVDVASDPAGDAGEPDLQGQLKVALRRYVQFEVSLSGSDAVFEGLT